MRSSCEVHAVNEIAPADALASNALRSPIQAGIDAWRVDLQPQIPGGLVHEQRGAGEVADTARVRRCATVAQSAPWVIRPRVEIDDAVIERAGIRANAPTFSRPPSWPLGAHTRVLGG